MVTKIKDLSFNLYFTLSVIIPPENVCKSVCVCFIPPKVLNLLCNWILKQGNKTEWSAPRGIFDIWRELGCLWDSTLSIWILIPLSLSILCRLSVWVSQWVCVCACKFSPLSGKLSLWVFLCFVFYCSQLSVSACLCTWVCAGSSEEPQWTIVCDLNWPSAAWPWANNAAAGPAGLPVCRPLCTVALACCGSPLSDLLTSAWANEQVARLSWGPFQQLSFAPGSRWWHLSSSLKECEGGSSEWKSREAAGKHAKSQEPAYTNRPRTAALIIH